MNFGFSLMLCNSLCYPYLWKLMNSFNLGCVSTALENEGGTVLLKQHRIQQATSEAITKE